MGFMDVWEADGVVRLLRLANGDDLVCALADFSRELFVGLFTWADSGMR